MDLKRKKFIKEEQLLQEIATHKHITLDNDRLKRMAAKCLYELGFIERKVNGLAITEKGEIARQMGIHKFLSLEKIEREILDYSAKQAKREMFFLLVSFLLLILVFIFIAETNPEFFAFF